MPNSTLKLTYFNGRGRAEATRLACIIGSLDFEDDRFDFSKFEEEKAKTPYSAVPVVEIDGAQFAQSNAILRYVGKQTNLYPSCPLEALKVDEAVDAVEDFLIACFRYKGPDETRLRESRTKLVEEDAPKMIGGLDKRMAIFGDGPFVTGETLTIADLVLACQVNMMKSGMLDFVPVDVLDGYPRVMRAYHAVMNHEKVAEWYKQNPIKGVTA